MTIRILLIDEHRTARKILARRLASMPGLEVVGSTSDGEEAIREIAGLNPHVVLAVLYLCTSLMTEMVSNNATAIILAPIALSIATHLGVDPRPFLVAVAFASSAAFMTPISYQTNMMVYGPGSYRFTDYTRFGVAMNLGLWLLAVMLIPKIWPL